MNFLLSDLWQLIGGVFLFPLVLVIPGYSIGTITGVLNFENTENRLLKSLLLSIALCPWLTYIFIRFGGVSAAWIFYGTCWSVFGYYSIRHRTQLLASLKLPFKYPKFAFTAVGLLLALAFLLVDYQSGGRLIRPLMSHDFAKHIAVTDAISRTAIPPVNPSFSPGHPLPLFYYYFWFLLTSMVDLIGGSWIGPRGAVLASIIWCGIALVGTVHLYLSQLGTRVIRGLERRHFEPGYILLLVMGLDIIPMVGDIINRMKGLPLQIFPDVLWWNDQVASWFASVVWVPHHVGGFISCMVAFLLIIELPSFSPVKRQLSIIVCSIALASALGMTIWVALVAGVFLITWFLLVLFRRWKTEVWHLLAIGSLALLLATPFIADLQQANHLHQSPIKFEIRNFLPIEKFLTTSGDFITGFTRLLVLPINYITELGFFGLGGLIYWGYRKQIQEKLNRPELFMVILMATSILVCTFIRSSVANNDLGWRGFLFAQFVLLLFSIPLLSTLLHKFSDRRLEINPGIRKLSWAFLFLSICGFVLELYIMRWQPWGPIDAQTAAVRSAYEWIDENLPSDFVLQHYPDTHIEYFHALYGNHRVAVADRVYGKLYGVNETMFDSTFNDALALFKPDTKRTEAYQLVQKLGIDAIFLKYSDRIWADSSSWLSSITPQYSTPCCRIYIFDNESLSTDRK